jgi:hypothetical protein
MKQLIRLGELTAICLSLALFVACSKSTPPAPSTSSTSNKPAPTPTAPQVSGQNQNWKLVVSKTAKVHFEPDPRQINPMATESKPEDRIVLSIELEYLGPSGEVPTPDPFIDNSGRRVQIDRASMEAMDQTRAPSLEGPEFELLNWLQNLKRGKSKVQPRNVKTGEKFSFSYEFIDPKADNLKLVFADVPPILLPKPQEPEPSK